MLNVIYRSFITLIVLLVAGLFFGLQGIIYFSKDLPDYKKLEDYDPPIISRVYSYSGDVVAEYAKERRIYVEYQQIPQLIINAFIAAEDKNFFHHQGVDLLSLLRAAGQSALNIIANKRAIGGSTITQQVIKSFLLTNERTLTRKIKEAILAYRVSKVYSKEKILELYLNQIFLGHNSYGVAAASQSYFGKNLDELNAAEAAVLASLPKAPSSLNPFVYYDKAKIRRDWVLERMAEEKFISNAEAAKFIKTPINLNHKEVLLSWTENFYLDAVKKELINLFGEHALYTRGLIINTYLNPDLQKEAETSFRNGLVRYDRKHGWKGPIAKFTPSSNWHGELLKIAKPKDAAQYALAVILEIKTSFDIKIGCVDNTVHIMPFDNFKWAKTALSYNRNHIHKVFKVGDVILVSKDSKGFFHLAQVPKVDGGMVIMEPNSGNVLAMIGGYDFQRSYFNRVLQAKRQPGSAFKTFVFLTALADGYQPNAILLDEQLTISQGKSLPEWQPKNYDGSFMGPITMRTAFEKSRNIPVIRMVLDLGMDKIMNTANNFKVYNDQTYRNYSVALGAAETTLMKMTNAYNMIASGGMETKPRIIDSVYDRKGNLLYKDYDMHCRDCTSADINLIPEIQYKSNALISEDANYQVISLLQGAMVRGTGSYSNILSKTVAGKTGTTNNSHDAWFIGFTPYMTAGIYVGYDIPKDMGKKETGSTVALPIFIEFMQRAAKDIPDAKFAVPENIVFKNVDKQTGELIDDDLKAVDQKYTVIEAFKENSDDNKQFSVSQTLEAANTNNNASDSLQSILEALEIENDNDSNQEEDGDDKWAA